MVQATLPDLAAVVRKFPKSTHTDLLLPDIGVVPAVCFSVFYSTPEKSYNDVYGVRALRHAFSYPYDFTDPEVVTYFVIAEMPMLYDTNDILVYATGILRLEHKVAPITSIQIYTDLLPMSTVTDVVNRQFSDIIDRK